MELCEHDWIEEYYGTRCLHCGLFFAWGHAPWDDNDPAILEIQARAEIED